MKDIFEAIEQLSALLSFRIENVARARGWATKPYSWLVSPDEGRLVIVVATTLYLPQGLAASFTPRAEPQAGQGGWNIDVRRTDSVVREAWSDGLSVVKNDRKYVLWHRQGMLSDETLGTILDELGRP
jgi:hypothetical protein